jgi:hypothetical protein
MNVLLRAADAIEQYGHTKHTVGSEERGFCIQGAIAYAISGRTDDWSVYDSQEQKDAMRAVFHIIEADSEVDPAFVDGDVCDWNNEDQRTAEECIEVLRLAAAA